MTERYIVKHKGFNREKRRHDSSAKLYLDEAIKLGLPVFKNKPYEKK